MAIAAPNDGLYRRLCEAIGRAGARSGRALRHQRASGSSTAKR